MVVEVMPQFLDVYCITELMYSGEITLVKHPWTSLRADSPRDWGYPSPSPSERLLADYLWTCAEAQKLKKIEADASIFLILYVKPIRSLLIQRTPAGSSFRLLA